MIYLDVQIQTMVDIVNMATTTFTSLKYLELQICGFSYNCLKGDITAEQDKMYAALQLHLAFINPSNYLAIYCNHF